MERIIPNKGDVHYIVFTTNGEILKLNTLKSFFRQDIKLIIKRTFVKPSRGKKLYDYYKNQILNNQLRVVRNNRFDWNGIQVRIDPIEYWDEVIRGYSTNSVLCNFEVTDRLGRKNIIRYNMAKKDVFETLKDDLDIIDKVGSHQGLIEIKKLRAEIEKLKKKI